MVALLRMCNNPCLSRNSPKIRSREGSSPAFNSATFWRPRDHLGPLFCRSPGAGHLVCNRAFVWDGNQQFFYPGDSAPGTTASHGDFPMDVGGDQNPLVEGGKKLKAAHPGGGDQWRVV
jgi:hypothetical protein